MLYVLFCCVRAKLPVDCRQLGYDTVKSFCPHVNVVFRCSNWFLKNVVVLESPWILLLVKSCNCCIFQPLILFLSLQAVHDTIINVLAGSPRFI